MEIILVIPPLVLFLILLVAAVYRQIKLWSLTKQLRPIPVYQRPKYKLYEVGVLIDGVLHDRDFVAALAHLVLNPDAEKDQLETEIASKMANKRVLNTILHTLQTSKNKNLSESNPRRSFTYLLFRQLLRNGYAAYNPFIVRTIALVTMIVLLFVDYAFITKSPFISDWQILNMSILGTIAIFAYSFHLNIEKVVEARSILLGYRMFLRTTEFYTVQKDLQVYEKHIPMMIALGVHTQHWPELLEYLTTRL